MLLFYDREIEVIKMLIDYKVENVTCCRFYASIAYLVGCQRHYVFSLSICLCMRIACMSGQRFFSTGLPSTSRFNFYFLFERFPCLLSVTLLCKLIISVAFYNFV